MSQATETVVSIKTIVASMFTAMKSFLGLLPVADESKNGAVKRHDTVLFALLNAAQHRCDWVKANDAFDTLVSQLGTANVEAIVRYMLKSNATNNAANPVNLANIGKAVTGMWESATKVQEHPEAGGYNIPKELSELFCNMTALSVARSVKNPLDMLERMRKAR